MVFRDQLKTKLRRINSDVLLYIMLCVCLDCLVFQVELFLPAEKPAGVDRHHQFVGQTTQQPQVSANVVLVERPCLPCVTEARLSFDYRVEYL